MKIFVYKVYDQSDNFIKTWDDVVSEPSFSQDINSAGGQMTIKLARNPDSYGESDDITFNNVVKVYVKDKELSTPTLIFQGYIADYTPYYGQNDEGVQITLLTLGDTLKDYLHIADELAEQSQATSNTTETFGGTKSIAQSFIPAQNTINSVDIKIAVIVPQTITITIQTNGSGNEPSGTTVLNSTVSKLVTDTTATVQRFTFSTPVSLTIGSTYWLVLS